ncbi:MAG: hypothetical protein EOO43_02800 [Flavobacterium sp.]|nr:MAG: hypothetical protein EOO43_02800 [Flavobacterium sp.]
MKKNIRVSKIVSQRNFNYAPYWHLIYEWEDDFANGLSVSIEKSGFTRRVIARYFLSFLDRFKMSFLYEKLTFCIARFCAFIRLDQIYLLLQRMFFNGEVSLHFEMYPTSYYSLVPMKSRIPYIIDFDMGVNLQKFYYNYRNCSIVLISGKEAYNYLKAKQCPLNIQHVPLSLSDRYRITNENPLKKYDIFIGRKNKILESFLKKFLQAYPHTEYIVPEIKGKKYFYRSNIRGIIGEFPDRKSFLNLLSECRVAFYTTPGMDEPNTKFINHVTSRLFEFVVSRCLLLGRYPDNSETREFKVAKVCPHIAEYDSFEKLMVSYLHPKVKLNNSNYSEYLSENYTSGRVAILKTILKQHVK